MGEAGIGPAEVAKEISEHSEHSRHTGGHASRHDRRISIVEAALLAIVALTAAWSGYASAKWSTESRLTVAQASTARNAGNAADLAGLEYRVGDALTFNAWFSAHVAGKPDDEAVAIRRMRPNFQTAFNAWLATDPDHNPNAPAGPQLMPEYHQPRAAEAKALKAKGERLFAQGSDEGEHGDDYVRITVYLATVLFLVGISTQFPIPAARYGLIGLGVLILAFSVSQLLQLPAPS
ncbi:MAG: hypothetical protein ACXVKA_16960 [Acidimicrobiia bacterium]